MKKHTSMTDITRNYKKVFRCGYCDLQYIMRCHAPQFYNAGVYGWNCDVYTIGNIAITTGYRNMRGALIPDKLIKKYSEIAKVIAANPFGEDFDTIYKKTENNIYDFISELDSL